MRRAGRWAARSRPRSVAVDAHPTAPQDIRVNVVFLGVGTVLTAICGQIRKVGTHALAATGTYVLLYAAEVGPDGAAVASGAATERRTDRNDRPRRASPMNPSSEFGM